MTHTQSFMTLYLLKKKKNRNKNKIRVTFVSTVNAGFRMQAPKTRRKSSAKGLDLSGNNKRGPGFVRKRGPHRSWLLLWVTLEVSSFSSNQKHLGNRKRDLG